MRGTGMMLLGGLAVVLGAWSACADPPAGPEQVQKFLQKLKEAEKKAAEPGPALPPFSKAEAAGEAPAKESKGKEEEPGTAELEILKKANVGSDAAELLNFFKVRTLPDDERPTTVRLVRQLGAESYRLREEAAVRLVTAGPKVLELLRSSHHEHDVEVVRRLERCQQRIQEADVGTDVYAAVIRLLGLKKPAGTVEVMLGYVPFTDDDYLTGEIRDLLAGVALADGKPDSRLRAGLTDAQPARRAMAGEVLCRAALASQKDAVRKLLDDREPIVRYRVAQAMAYARQGDALPKLIETLPELPLNRAWDAEDFLFRLAAAVGRPPPAVSLANDAASRQRCRDAWLAWWQKQAGQVNLARLEEKPKLLGRTLLVLLDQGRVQEMGPDREMRWHIDGLVFPLDVQLIDDARVLVAEYHANRVSERDLRGNILWQKAVAGPLVAQRLPNGNTFIATDSQLLEYDKADNEVLNLSVPDDGKKIMKAMKLPSEEVACLTSDARVVRYDVSGKELKEIYAFPVQIGIRLFGGRIHMLPSGRVLVPHNAEDKVVEYDALGKVVWEVAAEKPVAAVRLPNGHTLITSMNPMAGAVEVDRTGREVWSYRTSTRVTRALKR